MHLFKSIYNKTSGTIDLKVLKNDSYKYQSYNDNKISELTDAQDIYNISTEMMNSKFTNESRGEIFENICENNDQLVVQSNKSVDELFETNNSVGDSIKRIIVMGYFDNCNIGDEQYKITFKYIFDTYLKEKYEIIYLSFDKINNMTFLSTDIIVIGGGDILNDYFIDKLNEKFFKKPNKIIAFSVGLPYDSILMNTTKLNMRF